MLFLKGRLSFPALFEPESFEGGPEKFAATLLIPKDSADAKAVWSALTALRQSAGWTKKLPADKIAPKDGDEYEYASHHGNMVLKASNAARPVLVGRNKAPLSEGDGVLYSGCWVVGKVELWVQDNKWGKRINAKLHGVMFYEDGDPFGFRRPAER